MEGAIALRLASILVARANPGKGAPETHERQYGGSVAASTLPMNRRTVLITSGPQKLAAIAISKFWLTKNFLVNFCTKNKRG